MTTVICSEFFVPLGITEGSLLPPVICSIHRGGILKTLSARGHGSTQPPHHFILKFSCAFHGSLLIFSYYAIRQVPYFEWGMGQGHRRALVLVPLACPDQ